MSNKMLDFVFRDPKDKTPSTRYSSLFLVRKDIEFQYKNNAEKTPFLIVLGIFIAFDILCRLRYTKLKVAENVRREHIERFMKDLSALRTGETKQPRKTVLEEHEKIKALCSLRNSLVHCYNLYGKNIYRKEKNEMVKFVTVKSNQLFSSHFINHAVGGNYKKGYIFYIDNMIRVLNHYCSELKKHLSTHPKLLNHFREISPHLNIVIRKN